MREDGRLPSGRELFHDRANMDKNRNESDGQRDRTAGVIAFRVRIILRIPTARGGKTE